MEFWIKFIMYSTMVFMTGFSILSSVLTYRNRKKPLPDVVKDVYDEQKYNKWLKYSMHNFKIANVKKFISLTIDILLLSSGFYVLINDILVGIGVTKVILNTILFFIISSSIDWLVNVIFDTYLTFVVEKKYGFSTTTTKTFILDKLREVVMSCLLISAVIAIILSIYLTVGLMVILYATLVFFVCLILIMVLYGKVFSKLSNKQTPLQEGSLKNKIVEFANKVNFKVSDIVVIDGSKRTKKANAYCTGFGKMKRIVLYDTLLTQATEEEIVAVLAHEIGHSKQFHQLRAVPFSLANIAIIIGLLVVFMEYPIISQTFGFDDVHHGFAIVLFFSVIHPLTLLLGLCLNLISRENEYQADLYSATNYSSEHMISALKTLSRKNFVNLNPHPFSVFFGHSHPPMHKRIEAIQEIEKKA